MASDYNTAGIHIGHNTYILLSVVADLSKGFHTDANERRFISASRADLEAAVGCLQGMIATINAADTSQSGPCYVPHASYRE